MQARITKISRIRRHPTMPAMAIVQVYGSEHRAVARREHAVTTDVVRRTVSTTAEAATAAETRAKESIDTQEMKNLHVNQQVLFIPIDTILPERIAIALAITAHCQPLVLSATTPTNVANNNTEGLCRVVAVDFERIVSHAIVLPLISLISARNAAKNDIKATVTTALREIPFYINDVATSTLLDTLQISARSEYVAQKHGLLRTHPLADLLHNPRLLNALLETRVWMSERLRGTPIAIQYDADRDCVRFWDESDVVVPHAWWTMTIEHCGAREMCARDVPVTLLQHAAPLQRIAVQRYGKAIDLYLRGILPDESMQNAAVAQEQDRKVYFYECALHGARSFVLSAEQFLRMCESSRFPSMPTLDANQTLRSIVNKRLGRKRILLAPGDISFLSPLRAAPGATLHQKNDRKKSTDNSLDVNSAPDATSVSSESDTSASSKYRTKTCVSSGGADFYNASRNREKTMQQSTNWRRTTPINDDDDDADDDAGYDDCRDDACENNERNNERNNESTDESRGDSTFERRFFRKRADNSDKDFNSAWFGGVARERVDWAQCLVLIANQLFFNRNGAQRVGIAIQVYSGSDLHRIAEQFPYMRCRVGAEVLSEQHLLLR